MVFEYELAGMGSRMFAAMLDALIIGAVLAGILLVLVIVLAATGGGDELGLFGTAAAGVSVFALFWGYPIAFEIAARGQTPGKKALGIRVIRDGGYALTPAVVVVRNLLRVADFLPAGYFLGLVVMACSGRYKRIGDYVAGTLVVRDRKRSFGGAAVSTRSLESPRTIEGADDLRRAGAHRLEPAEVRLIEDFLARRASLDGASRRRVADRIAAPLAARFGMPAGESEGFLKSLLLAHRQGEAPPSAPPPPPEAGA